MKRIMTLLIACACFACEKSEVMPAGESLAGSVASRSASSEVYVEDGYLVLKDFQALDSIERLVSEMSDAEQLAWEKQLGFESAYTHFMPYFDEFDALEDEADMVAFQQQHKDVLRVINEDGMCDVDYPFDAKGRAAILSVDGKIKINGTLWIYKADRKVTILDGTEENVKKYADATFTDENAGVYVDYFNLNAPQTRAGQADGAISYDKNTEIGDTRAYEWSLDRYPERAGNAKNYMVALYQRGFKAEGGKIKRTIKTRYESQIHRVELNGKQIVLSTGITRQTSSKGRGGRYFKIFRITQGAFPSFEIIISHRSQGYFPLEKNPLIHVESAPSKPLDGLLPGIMKYDGIGKY